jgi:hypothetical protein
MSKRPEESCRELSYSELEDIRLTDAGDGSIAARTLAYAKISAGLAFLRQTQGEDRLIQFMHDILDQMVANKADRDIASGKAFFLPRTGGSAQ